MRCRELKKYRKLFVYYLMLSLPICSLLATICYASIPTDWYYGRIVSHGDAKSVGLAGTELFEPSVFFNNPLKKGLGHPQLSLSYSLDFLLERRTVLAYDQFDNTVGEVAIAENMLNRGNIGNIKFLMPLEFMNISAGLQPQYNYNYYFTQEFRDEFYSKIGETELKVIGTVYQASLMAGKEFAQKFGIGAGLNYYFGSRKFMYDSIFNGNHVTAETTGSPNGIGFSAGFSLLPLERVLVNITYQSAVTLNKFTTHVAHKYPAIYNLGVSYLAAGEIPTKLGLSLQYLNWNTLQSDFAKTLEVGIGVEHTMFNTVELRYGFRFEPSFVLPTVHQGSVSFGWGFMVGNIKVDVGTDIKRRIINSENLIVSEDNTLKIYQNTGEILIGALLPIDKLW